MFEVSELALLKLLPADKNELINTHYCYFCYFFQNIIKKIMKSYQNPSGLIIKTPKQTAKRKSQSQVTSSLGHASG